MTAADVARDQARRVADLEKLRLADARSQVMAGKGDSLQVAQACRRIATAERQVNDGAARRSIANLELRAAHGDLP